MKVYIIAGIDETPIGGFLTIDKVFTSEVKAKERLEELKYDSVNYKITEKELIK